MTATIDLQTQNWEIVRKRVPKSGQGRLWYSSVGAGRRVGTAAQPRGGGADPGFWGAIFLKKNPEKWLFGGMFV